MDIQGILDDANKLVSYLNEKLPKDCDDEQKLQTIVERIVKDTSLQYLRDAIVDVFVLHESQYDYDIYIDLQIDEKISICICTVDTDDYVYGYIRKHDAWFFVGGIRDDDKIIWRPNYRSGEYYSHEP
jgi:hypothetical protein